MTLLIGIKLLLALLIPLFFGLSLLLFLFKKPPVGILFSLALSYGLGLGLLAQWMLILGILQVPFSFVSIGLPLIILAAFFWLLRGRQRSPGISPPTPTLLSENTQANQRTMFIWLTFLLIIISCQIVFVFWRAWNVPVLEWDEISIIAFKAKTFFFQKILFKPASLPHSMYPLHTPFMLTWVSILLGQWDEQLVKFLLPFTFLSFLLIYYFFLKFFFKPSLALLGIILLTSSNFFIYHATIAYRDFFMLYYNCITLLLLMLWAKKQATPFLLLAGLFSGFTTFVKLEGTLYLFIHTILFLSLYFKRLPATPKRHIPRLAGFFIPSYGMCLLYHLYRMHIHAFGTVHKLSCDLSSANFQRILPITQAFANHLFLSGNWNILWFLCVLSLLKLKTIHRLFEPKFFLAALFLYFGTYFLLGLFTPNFFRIGGIENELVLARIFLHFFPLAILFIFFVNVPYQESEHE